MDTRDLGDFTTKAINCSFVVITALLVIYLVRRLFDKLRRRRRK